MKRIIISLFILSLSFIIGAQTIDYVFATVQDKNIVVTFSLKSSQPSQTFDVELWYSADNSAYKKCETINCSDGPCRGIPAGNNKNVTWFVLQDLEALECKTLDFEVRAFESRANNELTGSNGSFIDNRDKHNYKWVQIGNQTIMAENLAYQAQNGNCWAVCTPLKPYFPADISSLPLQKKEYGE